MMQLIFFAVYVLTLLLGHAFFWFVFIKLFQITTFKWQLIAALIILIFFINTIVASYLIHKWDNTITRTYYIMAGFWIGVLANFGVMMIMILFIKIGSLVFGLNPSFLLYKVIFVGGAIILSIVGLYRASVPKVTSYEVFIKDLPDSWNNKVVVQISDVHLGAVYREKSFARLLATAQSLNPEAVFITGDLFDGMETDFSWLKNPFSKINIPRGIYYSFGNHDLYLGFDRSIQLLKDMPVTILDNKMSIVDGLQIIGINYSFNKDFDLEAAILKQVGYTKDKPSILLFHEPKNIELAKNAEIDLQLSGHTHDGQIFPFNYLAKLSYKGYGYGLFNEGDFSLIVNGGAGTWGPPMRTASQSEIVKIILKKK
ncbi:MAG: metallophosphoesterase [Patescibacteria group bacterium]